MERGTPNTPDDASGLNRFDLTDEEVVQLEVQAIYQLAEQSRGELTALAVSRKELADMLDGNVTEVEWKALTRTLRKKPHIVARFLSNIISHHRASKQTHPIDGSTHT